MATLRSTLSTVCHFFLATPVIGFPFQNYKFVMQKCWYKHNLWLVSFRHQHSVVTYFSLFPSVWFVRALTVKFFGMHKTKSISQYTSTAGEQKNSRYFRATVFGNGSGFGKYLKKHYFYLVKMRHCTSWSWSCLVSFGVFWLSLVFYGVPSCLWPLLFQDGLISRFMFIFDRSDEKLKLWWNSSVLIMKHFDLMKWPRN